MGTASALFSAKQATTMNASHYVDNGNVIFNTIKAAGMVQVAHSVIPGQCNKLVLTSTGVAEDVVVTLSNSTWSSEANTAVKGMQVYKHPHLNFYLKVEIHETGSSASNYGPAYTAMTVRYYVALSIDAAGALVKPQMIVPRGGNAHAWSSTFNPALGTGAGYSIGVFAPLKVSVGVDHFCLGHVADMQTYEASQLRGSTSTYHPGGPIMLGYASCAIAIVKAQGSEALFVLIPRHLASSTSYPNEVNGSYFNEFSQGLPRQYRLDPTTGTLVDLGVSFFSALQVGVVSDRIGVRVAQMQTMDSDTRVSLPLLAMHAGAVADTGVVTVDVDGNGPRQYFAVYGFGGSAWHPSRYPLGKHPIYLLPWGD